MYETREPVLLRSLGVGDHNQGLNSICGNSLSQIPPNHCEVDSDVPKFPSPKKF